MSTKCRARGRWGGWGPTSASAGLPAFGGGPARRSRSDFAQKEVSNTFEQKVTKATKNSRTGKNASAALSGWPPARQQATDRGSRNGQAEKRHGKESVSVRLSTVRLVLASETRPALQNAANLHLPSMSNPSVFFRLLPWTISSIAYEFLRVVTKIDAPRIEIIDGPSVEAVGSQGSAPARQEGSPLPPSPSHRPVG